MSQELQERRDNTAPGASFEEDLARQEAIFEGRAAELLAEHPDRFIAVCGGEVFVGDSDAEAVSRARAAHPGRPFFLRLHDPLFAPASARGGAGEPEAAPGAAFEEDHARQEAIFEGRAAELLAEHPDRFIAVCGGEVFVGDSDAEAVSRARAAHPGRPFFLRLYDPCLEASQ